MDHLRLLCEIGELNWIFSDSASTKAFLQRIVAIVAMRCVRRAKSALPSG